MGNWRITIEGHGIHHNGRADDANAIAARCVQELRHFGHEVTKEQFALASKLGPSGDGEILETNPPEKLTELYLRLNLGHVQTGPEAAPTIIAAEPPVSP